MNRGKIGCLRTIVLRRAKQQILVPVSINVNLLYLSKT